MNYSMSVGRNGVIKNVEMSDCTLSHGFRLVMIGHIPKEKNDDLSVLLLNLLEEDSLSTDKELQKFKKNCRKEGFFITEKTYLNHEPKSALDDDKRDSTIVTSVTTYFRIHRTPKRWFNER